jgi:hypothetical protein
MNTFIPVIAAVDSPEIYGAVSLHDPSIWDSSWVKAATVALFVLFALAVWLVIRRIRERRLEELSRDPLYIMRTRLQTLRSSSGKSGKEFYGELASVMRGIVGLHYKIGATPKTAKELRAALTGTDNANLADGALNVVEACESAQFASDVGIDADKLLSDASAAFELLAPHGMGESKAGGVTR